MVSFRWAKNPRLVFQLAEVMVTRDMFDEMFNKIGRLGPGNNCFETAQGKVRDLKGEFGLKGSFRAFQMVWTPFSSR